MEMLFNQRKVFRGDKLEKKGGSEKFENLKACSGHKNEKNLREAIKKMQSKLKKEIPICSIAGDGSKNFSLTIKYIVHDGENDSENQA